MGRLSNETVAEMVGLYRDDPETTLGDVAGAYGVTAETVTKHLHAAGVPIRPEGGNESDKGTAPRMDDITKTPAFQEAVAKAVAQTLADLGAPKAEAAPADWAEFMQSMKQLAQSMDQQRPGYAKPLSPEELADREEGRIAFFRLLDQARDAVEEYGRKGARERGLVPEYTVGPNGFYMPTDDGEQLFSPGQPLFLTAAPPADFEPLNEAAGLIMAAQKQWLGEEVQDVGEMVAAAQMRALGHDPDKADRDTARRTRVVAEIDHDRETVRVGPRRIMGTTVEETGNDGHTQFRLTKGSPARPVSGPVFVN